MFKWIKSLFVSKRLKAVNERIEELETEVQLLTEEITLLEDTFMPYIPHEVIHESAEPLLFLSRKYITRIAPRYLELTFKHLNWLEAYHYSN